MAEWYDEDPLNDYNPGEPSPSTKDADVPPGPEPDMSDIPDHLAGIDIPEGYELLTEEGYPLDEQAYADIEQRDYNTPGERFFPTEQYGGYEENYPEDAAAMRSRASHRAGDRAQMSDQGLDGTAEKVVDTLRNCYAAMQGRNGGEMLELVAFTLSSTAVMAYLDATMTKTYDRLAEVLVSEYADDRSRTVDLEDIPGIDAASSLVRGELTLIRTRVGRDGLPKTPSATWKALVNYVQRVASRQTAMRLAAAVDAGDSDELCMDLFRKMEPPTSSRTLQNTDFSRTAKEWEESDIAAAAEAPGFRISSGYPTLDYAFTQQDGRGVDIEPRGAWGPGEFHLIAAPTGNGKSSAGRTLVRNAAEDLVKGWGREHDKVLIAITEEAPRIVYTVAGMGMGQPFHHLASSLIIANIGASRCRFIHAVWDTIIDAYHRSQETGVPIVNCGLPSLIVLDYIGGLTGEETNEAAATEKTANLLLRGVAMWDLLGMESFTGESFAAYAGMGWPAGMENYQPAVLGFAQFVKLKDPLWFDPNARGANVEDFMIPNPDGSAGWEVLPGDFRIPTQGEIRGSGVQANHSTSILILHRSRPQKNPKVFNKETGRVKLADDRARWILVKTRNGSNLPFIEMRFDSIPSGLRGQFFDRRAEHAIARGLLRPTDCYMEAGDPILPHRPVRTPFDGISY